MKVATWNIGDGPDNTKVRGLVKLVKAGVDVLGLQECGDRGDLLDEFCKRTGWHMWPGDGSPGASSVPILWNPATVKATRTGTNEATDPTWAPGRGPDRVKAKVWNRVRLHPLHEHHAAIVVINGHLPASLYMPGRRRIAVRQVAVLERMVEQRAGHVPVVALMDGNSKPTDRLWKPLRQLGMVQRTHRPTHGRRTIDLIWTHGIGGRVEVLDMPSDHNAVVFETR